MRRRVLAGCLLATAAFALLPAAPAAAAPGPADAPEWWFDTWHVQSLWDEGARGQGITIAEVDTGVSGQVPELRPSLLSGTDFGSAGGNGQTDHELDTFGHGTAMASIMVAHPGLLGITGLAPDAKVLPVAVPIRGTDDAAANGADQLPAAIRWSVDHGGKIISLSLGGTRNPSQDSAPCPTAEQSAITYAVGKGAIVVAASGNSGDDGSPVEDPGVCLGVVSVGAVDRNDEVATFSSRHPYLTVAAPGVDIPSLGRLPGSAFSGDGTSQATALTSATLALVWSKYPALTGEQIVTRLLATLDRHAATRNPGYGFGIVNAERAVNATVPADAPNPVYAAVEPFVTRQQAEAAARAPASSPPAPVRAAPPGVFAIGAPPSAITDEVLIGIAVTAAGAVALVALVTAGVTRRRRLARYAALHPDGAPGTSGAADWGRVDSAARDLRDLAWHDVTNAEWSDWPNRPDDRPPPPGAPPAAS